VLALGNNTQSVIQCGNKTQQRRGFSHHFEVSTRERSEALGAGNLKREEEEEKKEGGFGFGFFFFV